MRAVLICQWKSLYSVFKEEFMLKQKTLLKVINMEKMFDIIQKDSEVNEPAKQC